MFSPLISLASRTSKNFFSLKRQRFDALTGLRAVAAAMVFVYHNRKFWYGWLPDPLMRFFNEFHLGVAVFFVLSGFVIGYTYNEKPLRSKTDYGKYILVRLARILPMYYIIVTAEFFRTGFPSATEITVAYSLTQGYFYELILTGLPQAWSLTVEMAFYLLAPLLFLYVRKNLLKTLFVLLLFLGAAIATGSLLNHFHYNKDGFLVDPVRVLNYSFFGRFPEFICGIFLAQVMLAKRAAPWLKRIKYPTLIGGTGVLVSIILCGLFQTALYTNGGDTSGGGVVRETLFAFSTMLFTWGLLKEKTWVSWFLSSRLMIILGNASYIFFLIHLKVVNFILWDWHIFPDRNFCVLWLVSVAAYYVIEKPLYEWLKKLVAKIKSQKAADPVLQQQQNS